MPVQILIRLGLSLVLKSNVAKAVCDLLEYSIVVGPVLSQLTNITTGLLGKDSKAEVIIIITITTTLFGSANHQGIVRHDDCLLGPSSKQPADSYLQST